MEEVMQQTIQAFQLALASVTNSMSLTTDKVQKLEGIGSVERFFEELESKAGFGNLSVLDKLNFAKSALHGDAKEWYRLVGHHAVTNYDEFKIKLRSYYPEVVDRVALERELYSVTQGRHQAAAPFTLRKIDILTKLGIQEYTAERAVQIINSRLLPYLQDRLELNPPLTIFSLHERAVKDDLRHPVKPNWIPSKNLATPPPQYSGLNLSPGRGSFNRPQNNDRNAARNCAWIPNACAQPARGGAYQNIRGNHSGVQSRSLNSNRAV